MVTGWSQGAQVVTDIISGGGGVGMGNIAKCTQNANTAMDPMTEPGKNGNLSFPNRWNGVEIADELAQLLLSLFTVTHGTQQDRYLTLVRLLVKTG